MKSAPSAGRVVVRLYRLALRLLPRSMAHLAPALEATFVERVRDRRDSGLRATMVWVTHELADVVATALRLRIRSLRPPHDRKGDGMLSTLWSDVRIATRSLVRRPAFLFIAALTLALGIGANAAMFSVLNAVVLRPLSYPESDRLVMVFHTLPHLGAETGPLSLHNFLALEEGARAFRSLGAATGVEAALLDRGEAQRVTGWRVTGGFFRTLGVDPALGRTITPADDSPGADRVIVLAHGLWTTAFGASPDVIGSVVRLDSGSYTVIGVMPASFGFGGARHDYWTALALDPAAADRDTNFLTVVGRLSDGADIGAALREADTILAREAETLASDRLRNAYLVSRHEYVVRGVRQQLVFLLGAVLLVLLVACANVAGLTLTRTARRGHELAVRTALGARRRTLVRHLLAESAVIATAGGALAVMVAAALTRLLIVFGPADLPRRESIAVDGATLAFLAATTGLCALVVGLVPAFRAARDPGLALREGARAGTTARPQALLAGAQIALAAVLLVGAGLLGRSFVRLQNVDPGFQADGVLTALVPFPEGTEQRGVFVSQLDERLTALPGVQAVGITWSLPFALGDASTRAMRDDQSTPADERLRIWISPVTPGYFRAMGMPLVAGTEFHDGHRAGPPVAVVNEALAGSLWPGEPAIGKRFLRGGGDDPTLVEVVGVVPDTRINSLDETEPRPFAYQPFSQTSWAGRGYVVLRTTGDPLALVAPLRAAVADLDDAIPVDAVSTLAARVDASLARPRFRTTLVGAFALLGALLALVGVYGVMALLVTSRTREIGVRMALGAARRQVHGSVLAGGLRIALAGLAVGLVGAALLSRIVERFLYDVTALDPVTYAVVAAALLLAVALAVLPAARRASAVDPLHALRAE